MPISVMQLDKLYDQLSGLADALAERNGELTNMIAVGILNGCPLVRPDWRISAVTRVMNRRNPILYTSHFEFEEGLISGHEQRCLYVLLTHLIEMVVFDDLREKVPCGKFLCLQRVGNLREKILPELFLILDMMSSLEGLAVGDNRRKVLEVMDEELKQVIDAMREGESL